MLANGATKVIEQLKVGDKVLARDEVTGKTEAKKITRTFKRQVEATLVLSFSNGDKIECTKEHPFYVEHKGFTPAAELGIGTSIVTRAGPSAKLERVEVKDAQATVYNFEVEDLHSYFVGDHDGGLWVHNECMFGPAPKLNVGKQGIHILGEFGGYRNFQLGKSIVTADPYELAKYAGMGRLVGPLSVGLPGSKEAIDFGQMIGYFVDKNTGLGYPTTNGIIHYGGNGIHIVPSRP